MNVSMKLLFQMEFKVDVLEFGMERTCEKFGNISCFHYDTCFPPKEMDELGRS